MNCSAPPELNDNQLWTSVDGVAPREVRAHLVRCPYCSARAARLARLSQRLRANLYRIPCPPPIALGEYHLGVLDPTQAEEIARHLDDCLACRGEIARLSTYLEQLAPEREGDLLARARVLIASLVAGGGLAHQPGLAPAFSGLRGADDEPAIYQAETIRVAIDIQPDSESPTRRTLLGLVTGAEAHRLRAQLRQADLLIATAQVDALGNFVIGDLVADVYDLTLSDQHVEVHISAVRI